MNRKQDIATAYLVYDGQGPDALFSGCHARFRVATIHAEKYRFGTEILGRVETRSVTRKTLGEILDDEVTDEDWNDYLKAQNECFFCEKPSVEIGAYGDKYCAKCYKIAIHEGENK